MNNDAFVCQVVKGSVVLPSFMSTQPKLESLEKREPQLRTGPHQTSLWATMMCVFLIDGRGSYSLWEVPLLGHDAQREQDEEAIMSKPVSSTSSRTRAGWEYGVTS